MKHRLTKSAYLQYLRCPKEFWLQMNQPLFVSQPYSLEYEHLRQQGYAVQQLARKLDRFQPKRQHDFERPFKPPIFTHVATSSARIRSPAR